MVQQSILPVEVSGIPSNFNGGNISGISIYTNTVDSIEGAL